MLLAPPIDLAEVVLLESLKLNIPSLLLRGLGVTLLIFNSFLFSKLFKKPIIPFFIFLVNPWTVYLHTFLTIQCLFLSICLLVVKRGKKALFIILSLVVFIYLQKTLPKDYLFLSKINFPSLATEINERQKIDFLATNKTYILPLVIRKITYNKPFLAFDKMLRHFVSFFDFEQFSSPLESYEIIKLSGLSPKGNFPFFFIWEIPFIVYGVFLNRKYLPYFLIALVPIFTAEKKLFIQTAFLSAPFIIFWEAVAVSKLFKIIKPKVFTALVIAFLFFGVFPYYKSFYTRPLNFRSSESYFYQKIAQWIIENKDKNIVVTSLFGPTEKMAKYYLGNIPSNVSFEAFDLNEEVPRENTYYIGLPGQFVKHGKDLQKKIADSRISIVSQITGDGELVFEYGDNLWIGYQK